jgi:hypothetical protein
MAAFFGEDDDLADARSVREWAERIQGACHRCPLFLRGLHGIVA